MNTHGFHAVKSSLHLSNLSINTHGVFYWNKRLNSKHSQYLVGIAVMMAYS